MHDSQKGLGKENVEEVILVERKEGEKWGDVEALKKLES